MLMLRSRGFTIVELLIVIVVIAILAAISIVTYNGIQTRAKNTKTINATNAWIKAIKLYEAKEGVWPSANSCLGGATTYQGNNGQCFNSGTWVVSATFTAQVQPYLTGTPEPDTTDVTLGGTNTPRRGALYHINGTQRLIWMLLSGVSACPDMSLPQDTANSGTEPGGMRCVYRLA